MSAACRIPGARNNQSIRSGGFGPASAYKVYTALPGARSAPAR